jgi:hypothetical protein
MFLTSRNIKISLDPTTLFFDYKKNIINYFLNVNDFSLHDEIESSLKTAYYSLKSAPFGQSVLITVTREALPFLSNL